MIGIYVAVVSVFFSLAYLTFRFEDSEYVLGLSATTVNTLLFLTLSIMVLYLLIQTTLKPIKNNMEAQKKFIASASHELRTPLSIMKTNSEVALLDEFVLSKDEAISTVRENLQEINRMSDILMILLQLDGENKNNNNQQMFFKTNLASIVTESIGEIKKLASHKDINIHTAIEDSAPIWGNEASLRAMTVNILNNSISYTPKGGSVYIYLKYKNNYQSIELRVRDTGVGISHKDIPHVFNPFYRTSKATNITSNDEEHQATHFGLGLSIVHKIVGEHKGTISIQSPEEQGAEVVIRFPVSLQQHKPSRRPVGYSKIQENM